ncbi:MAG: LacI family DNA-binding transcriptional regulator [Acidobacteriaceae bacterium]
MMAIRMKDIAQELGLSVVTISKVLRNHPDIAEETRERVMKRVRELDYQPNLLARSLVTGRSYLIGLVVPSLLHPFFAEIAKNISAAVGAQGYSILLSSSEEEPLLEAREIQQLTARRLDALVIATTGADRSIFDRLVTNRTPFVLIDREIPGLSANFVGIDDEAAGRVATEHLIQLGRRRIAHIRGRENSTGVRRFEGYRKALEKAGLEFCEDLVIPRSNVDVDSTRMGEEAMHLLLKRKPLPDALFAYNDPLAIGAMNAIFEAGLRIPQDIAVIGCGNLHYDALLRVPLSSMDQRSAQIGERTAEVLLRMIGSRKEQQTVNVILEPTLVVRESTSGS